MNGWLSLDCHPGNPKKLPQFITQTVMHTSAGALAALSNR